MKPFIRIAFAFSFFMAAGLAATHAQTRANILAAKISGSAKTDSFLFTLDTTPVRYQLGPPPMIKTVRGYIQNLTADSIYLGFKQTSPPLVH
jgi:hypothetical protein